jgi:hypothetical protein
VTVDEHISGIRDLILADHLKYTALVREWAEKAEADGRLAAARRHREQVARLEAIKRPWEREQKPA